ncbi:CobW family GTP-binding protein [Shewanella maritima]|uniref:CobW family GTP-binding protein n=1 Tax=Shewanella maritima TaxID=2520507 RepID=UPI003734C9B6
MKISTKKINVNVITGFLGVGKTSLIKTLLQHKPDNETWAVLVNEFGQVGIDASLMSAKDKAAGELLIKQVPGGCLCCAAGLPTQVAISQLIQQAKPDRILIEPTGLGHPKQIIQTLCNEYFSPVLQLDSVITLIDATKVADEKYALNDTFIQQARVADVVIASKSETYGDNDLSSLSDWLSVIGAFPQHTIAGTLPLQTEALTQLQNLICHPSTFTSRIAAKPIQTQRTSFVAPQAPGLFTDNNLVEPTLLADIDWQGEMMQYFTHQQQEYVSHGWVFAPEVSFGFDRFMTWVKSQQHANVVRLKGAVITYDGILGVNWVDSDLCLSELDETFDSRVEIIVNESNPCAQPFDKAQVEQALLGCIGGH